MSLAKLLRRWGVLGGVGLLLALLPAVRVAAQEPDSSISLWVDWVDVAQFPEVQVYLSVWDQNGLPVTGLEAQHFELREDHGPVRHPSQVYEDTQAPLQVVLALDISGSMAGKPLEDAKAAAARFLDRLGPEDRAALIAFSSPVDPDPAHLDGVREVGFTRDLDLVYEAIENLQSGGGTALYNAAQKAVGMAAALPAGHRAVLLLTDGRNDPPEVGDPDLAITLAREHRVPVFVIALGQDVDEAYLRRLARETGGIFRSAPSSAELARLFDEMAALLKTQYRLVYRSNLAPDGDFHELEIRVRAPQRGATAVETVRFGPLPAASPTATPSPTPKPAPTPTQTARPSPAVAVVVTPQVTPASAGPLPSERAWLWVVALAGFAALLAIFIRLRRRRRRPVVEFCAKCGYELTSHVGACPVCGSTRRLRK